MSRTTGPQLEVLVEFMEMNPKLANHQLRRGVDRLHARAKWAEVTDKLNSMEGAMKDPKSWAKFWADKKYSIKRRIHIKQIGTELGMKKDNCDSLSSLDNRILKLLGGRSAAILQKRSRVARENPANKQKPLQTRSSPSGSVVAEMDEEKPVRVPTPDNVLTKATQTTASSVRRSLRLMNSRQVSTDRQLLLKIEERMISAENLQVASWAQALVGLRHLAEAVILNGQTVANALRGHQ